MKIAIRFAVFLCALFFASTLSIFAQGPITPTGTPGATMKSLDQIEARTPISSLPFTISSSGSYYLTKNLSVSSTDGVTINASGVTLDLNGFEISSTEASPTHSGIVVSTGLRNIRIHNGSIRGSVVFSGSNTYSGAGFANGIQISGSGAPLINVHVSDLSISGCQVFGINLGAGFVEACNLSTIGGNGINADTVVNCYVLACGGVGITANISASGCTAIVTSSSVAIQADMAIACAGQTTPASGTGTITAEIARDCVAQANASSAGDAILASTAENCNGFALGSGSGIHCNQSAVNCYGTSSGSAAAVNVLASALNCYGVASGTGAPGLSALSAENCYGSSSGLSATGLDVKLGTALNCYGTSSGTNSTCIGLHAEDATGCFGTSTNGTGLAAGSATGCTGTTSTGVGLNAGHAENSSGILTSDSAPATAGGLSASSSLNCFGQGAGSGYALFSNDSAIGCAGYAFNGPGVTVNATHGIAVGCVGRSPGGGVGVGAFIAQSCANPSGTQAITNKYNMP